MAFCLLQNLEMIGQGIWLDFIQRDIVHSGGLQRHVNDDGISAVTPARLFLKRPLSPGTTLSDHCGD